MAMELRPLRQCCVLVTPTSYGADAPALKRELEAAVGRVIYNPHGRPLTSPEVAGLLPGVDGYIAGLDQIDAAALAGADCLKVIARYGVGLDRVDLAAATARGIVVANTPGANAGAVAELTIALLLTLARGLHQVCPETRCGQWPRRPGLALEGKAIGLVGLGAVGRALAKKLSGFGCRLMAGDPYLAPAQAAAAGVELMPLAALLPQAEFVSLHCPLTPQTRGLVNQAFLAAMKPGAYLVNTARGELIDEAALQQALQSGRLAGAALDCFHEEPPGARHPLLALPTVVATPHIGAHTDQATYLMGRMALDACLAALAGRPPAHVVNPQVYEAGHA